MMPEVFDTLEVRQSTDSSRDELPHRQDAILIRVELGKDSFDNLLRLLRVHLEVLGAFAALLVVDAVDRLEFVAVEDAVAVRGDH